MTNLKPVISPKEQRWTTIHYTIYIDIPYKEEILGFRIDFNEVAYPEKTVNEFEGISTPFNYVCENEQERRPVKIFKEEMNYYFTHDFSPLRKKELSRLEEDEIKQDVDRMWDIIVEELNRNNIPLPGWEID